jgi:hypothetical protein
MIRRAVGVCTLLVAVAAWPQVASAQWYVNPYVGTTMKIEQPFVDPALATVPESATVFGIAGGTNPFKAVGFELDFQRVNNMFRTGDSLFSLDEFEAMGGPNRMQSLTAAVHFGPTIGNRVRVFGLAGGGINMVNLGQEYQLDFESFFSLPFQKQDQIEACANALATPTVAAVQGCGMPLTTEETKGVRGLMEFGGGANVKLGNHVGAKVDLRRFIDTPKDEDGAFTFWRFTVGIVLHR